MKILVSFKSVPDPYAGLGESASKSVINPFDEIAIANGDSNKNR